MCIPRRAALSFLICVVCGSLAQAQTSNLYTGSMNGQVGFGVPIPFAGFTTTPGGPLQSPNVRGVGVPGPTALAPGFAGIEASGGFTLPPGDFFVSTSRVSWGSSSSFPFYSATHAMVGNGSGSFAPAFFTAAFGTTATVTLMGSGASGTPDLGTVIFRPGGGFGGFMRLAGSVVNVLTFSTSGGALSMARIPFPLSVVGGPAVPNKGFTEAVFDNTRFGPTTLPMKLSGFPWITGTVSLIQSQGVVASLLTEVGANALSVSTTGSGAIVASGSIKLVTGWLTHMRYIDENVGEYQLDLTFLPEPSRGQLAGAGLLLVVGLHRLRRVRRRRE